MEHVRTRVALLGSTGSIGRSVLDVVAAHPGRFELVAMTANRNTALLAEQVSRFGCPLVVVSDEADTAPLPSGVRVRRGAGALADVAALPEADIVVNALVGMSGLAPAAAAIEAGKRLALANKESLVVAGGILTRRRAQTGAEIMPVDSEHSSLQRCLVGRAPGEVARLILTASGGALRNHSRSELARVTVEDVLNHPTWDMGPKVTVDSATLVNKAFEVIEARWLFGIPQERIDVVLHAQSLVHCFVRTTDGSLISHISDPDMRVPIQNALFAPDAPPTEISRRRAWELGRLDFEPVDTDRYPCFSHVLEAGRRGGTAPAIVAAADEVAVSAFVSGKIPFDRIRTVIATTSETVKPVETDSLDDIVRADTEARRAASAIVDAVSRD